MFGEDNTAHGMGGRFQPGWYLCRYVLGHLLTAFDLFEEKRVRYQCQNLLQVARRLLGKIVTARKSRYPTMQFSYIPNFYFYDCASNFPDPIHTKHKSSVDTLARVCALAKCSFVSNATIVEDFG
ncbi:hypothetical protein RP20_CCG017799 [Aedes albopictus]|nr:hypothetical protein RP20_CCG017799 [Aedes albopictus]